MAEKSDFETKTADALVACAKWLDENANDLARAFAGGCLGWSVEFVAYTGEFPQIKVRVDKVDHGIIDAYGGKPTTLIEE